jgi:hypothetical protein
MVTKELTPSPDAVTTRLDSPGTARPEAVSVRVIAFVVPRASALIGFADQAAVNPGPSPAVEKLIVPAKDPPGVAESLTVAVAP